MMRPRIGWEGYCVELMDVGIWHCKLHYGSAYTLAGEGPERDGLMKSSDFFMRHIGNIRIYESHLWNTKGREGKERKGHMHDAGSYLQIRPLESCRQSTAPRNPTMIRCSVRSCAGS